MSQVYVVESFSYIDIQEQETVIQEEAVSKEEITDLEIQETTQIEQLPTELSTVVTLPEEEPEVKEPTSANTSIPTEIISDSTVDMSQSILEARCKRFGIPFNPTKQPVETKKQKKQQKKQNLHTNEVFIVDYLDISIRRNWRKDENGSEQSKKLLK